MKRYSTSLAIRKIKSKTTKLDTTTHHSEWLKQETLIISAEENTSNWNSLFAETKKGTASLENNLAVSYNVKHILPIDLAILLLGIYRREVETYVHTKSHMQMVTAALLLIVPNWKQFKCPSTGKWINKPWYI